MNETVLEVHPREAAGKNANRRLRAAGQLPAVVYGAGKPTVPIRVEQRKVLELLKSASGENTVFLLQLAGTGKSRHTMIRELQSDAVTGEMIHIDFQRVLMDQKVRVSVPVEVVGEAYGVRNEAGLLDFITREVEVECLPGDIPNAIELDVSPLHVGQHVEAGELRLPEEVELLEDAERVIVSVAVKRAIHLEEEEEEAEELLTAEAAEPEVIGRKEEEGGD